MTTPPVGSDRTIEFEGAFNVRDLGGLVGDGGRRLRRGLIFRADSPRRLTARDRRTVETMDLGHVVDLRTGEEAELGTWALAPGTRTWFYEVIDALPHPDRPDPALPTVRTPEAMAERYAWRMEKTAPLYAAAVETVIRYAPERVLFHCTAGKDRTGMIAAALLELLGVSRDDIAHDYALSTANVARAIVHMEADPLPGDPPFARLPDLAKQARADVMAGFLEIMDTRHGGLVALLVRRGLDVELAPGFRALMLG